MLLELTKDNLTALSYADVGSGLAIKQLRSKKISNSEIKLSWQPAEHASFYLVYYSTNPNDFDPCSTVKPFVTPVGNVTEYTLSKLGTVDDYYFIKRYGFIKYEPYLFYLVLMIKPSTPFNNPFCSNESLFVVGSFNV